MHSTPPGGDADSARQVQQKYRPATLYELWFATRDFLVPQLDVSSVDLVPLRAMLAELRGNQDATEALLTHALANQLPHGALSELQAVHRDVAHVIVEEGRFCQDPHDDDDDGPRTRLQPWEPAFAARLSNVHARKRRIVGALVRLLTTAQAEVLGVAAHVRSVSRGDDVDTQAGHEGPDQHGPSEQATQWVPASTLVDKDDPLLQDHSEVRRFCDVAPEKWTPNSESRGSGRMMIRWAVPAEATAASSSSRP